MRKLVIFLYFVFLFKLAFAQSLSLPKFNSVKDIEPSAGSEVAQVPSIENDSDELPVDFDLPTSGAASNDKQEEAPQEAPQTTTATIDINTPELELPSMDDSAQATTPVAPAAPVEVINTPTLPTQNVDNSAVLPNPAPADVSTNNNLDAADAALEKELTDDSVREQFPTTPGLGYQNEKTEKSSSTEVNTASEIAPEDREKEVDNLLDQVFDKEKTPEQLAQEEADKKKEAELAAKEKSAKQNDNIKIDNIMDVSEKPVQPIDTLKSEGTLESERKLSDDNDQMYLSEVAMPASMKEGNKSSPLKSIGRNTGSSTYSEQQLSDLLVKAAMRGDKQNVISLIRSGRNVNAQNTYGESALMGAVYNGHNGIVEILLSEGADANTVDNKGNSSLLVAAAKNNVQAVQELIRKGADIDLANNSSDTPLLVAALNNNLNVVDLLIRQGADVNKPNADGLTALHIAAYSGNAALAKYLISVGANANAIARGGFRPYDLAATKNPQLAQMLSMYANSKQQIAQAAKISNGIQSRKVTPTAQKINYNQEQYAMFPKAYVEKPEPQIEQLPQNNWWAAKSQPQQIAQQQNMSMPANNSGIQKADYSGLDQMSAKPASLSLASNSQPEKKWTKLTVEPKSIAPAKASVTQPVQQIEVAANTYQQTQPQALQRVDYSKYSNNFAAPKPVVQQPTIQTAFNTAPAQTYSVTRAPVIEVETQNLSTPSSSGPVRVKYDSRGNIITNATSINNPVRVSKAAPVFVAPASMNNVRPLNNTVAVNNFAPLAQPVRLAPRYAAPTAPQQVAAAKPAVQQPQFYNQPISNNINVNIPRYASLDASKQAVWDKKLEEWVMNGININAKDDSQKIFWVKQKSILAKVYEGQFNSKVQSIKKKYGVSAASVSPANTSKTASATSVTSKPVKLSQNSIGFQTLNNASPFTN